jgi:hypothetical protein
VPVRGRADSLVHPRRAPPAAAPPRALIDRSFIRAPSNVPTAELTTKLSAVSKKMMMMPSDSSPTLTMRIGGEAPPSQVSLTDGPDRLQLLQRTASLTDSTVK